MYLFPQAKNFDEAINITGNQQAGKEY